MTKAGIKAKLGNHYNLKRNPKMPNQQGEIVSTSILRLLPHRFPFLLVDRVLSYESNKQIHALKNVTLNEPYFQGHFPEYPVMPGVLIVEALAQTGGILVIKSTPDIPPNMIFLFSGIDKFRFKRPVYPGDQLHLHAHYLKQRLNIWKMKAEAKVDDKLAAAGTLTAALVPQEEYK